MEGIVGLFKTDCIRTTIFHNGRYQSIPSRFRELLETANIKLGLLATTSWAPGGRCCVPCRAGNVTAQCWPSCGGDATAQDRALEQALTGLLAEHLAFLLGELLDHIAYLDAAIERLSHRIQVAQQ